MLSRFFLTAALISVWATGFDAPPARAADPAAAPSPTPSAQTPAPSASLPPGDTVVGRVNGQVLRLSDVEAVQKTLPPQMQNMPLAQIYPTLLERMIDGMLVAAAARKEHLEQSPEVQQRLKLITDRLLQQAYIEQLIKAPQSDDQLKAAYQKLIQDKPAQDEVHARHILVKTQAEANSIVEQLNKGADFATLAKKYSTDPGAASGGDLGYFTRDDMVPAFATAAFALKPGQYTKTPVKTQFGWHVILVVDRRVKAPPTFEQARPELTRKLTRDVVEAKVKELRSEAKIEAYGLDGKPLATTQ